MSTSQTPADFASPQRLLGVGIDLVHISEFAEQLAAPGSRFQHVFSAAEQRLARRRATVSGREAEHFAVRWAAKEAFVKAWSVAIVGQPPAIDPAKFPWEQVAVLADAWGRPRITLSAELAATVVASLKKAGAIPHDSNGGLYLLVSMTHEKDYAQGCVHLLWRGSNK